MQKRLQERVSPSRCRCFREENERRGENRDRKERQRVNTHECRALHQRKRIGQGIADDVPGKPCEEMTPEPFREPEHQREQDDAAGASEPEALHQKCRSSPEEGDTSRQQGHRERQEPGELVSLDQEGFADPEEVEEKIPEAEPPAGHGRVTGRLCGIDHPNENGKRQEQDRKSVKGREGEDAEASRQKGRERAPLAGIAQLRPPARASPCRAALQPMLSRTSLAAPRSAPAVPAVPLCAAGGSSAS